MAAGAGTYKIESLLGLVPWQGCWEAGSSSHHRKPVGRGWMVVGPHDCKSRRCQTFLRLILRTGIGLLLLHSIN